MATRREFIRLSAAGGAALLFHGRLGRPVFAAPIPGGTLPPGDIPKFMVPLIIPPVMPRTSKLPVRRMKNIDYYEIAVRQFSQQVLPPGLPATTVWSYGSATTPGTFNYPAFTIESKFNKPARVKWINQLTDASGDYLRHLLAVDQTLHWANPAGGAAGRDTRPSFLETPAPYRGPVPIVTHVHGAHATEQSDGYAEAWYLPETASIPAGYATSGTWYETFRQKAEPLLGQAWTPGSAVFEYANDQAASTLWYHDHTLGMTRLNVYAGPAGFYNIRGGPFDMPAGVLPGPAPSHGDLPGLAYYEIPIVIQDRAFNSDGALFYPDSRAFFDGVTGPYVPFTDISPSWNPEFFGNTIVVNGRTWPFLQVEPRRYRFRLLNGCNSRFLILELAHGLTFWQIGAEGGFLPAPVELPRLLMSPAERADVIVDFTGVPVGSRIVLRNLGPDEPFGGGTPWIDFEPADAGSTGLVMEFEVVPLLSADTSLPPAQLTLPAPPPSAAPVDVTRQLSLNEMMSMYFPDSPAEATLGTVEGGEAVPHGWEDPITENPALGATEVWELHNFTGDAHPIHVHQVQFQVLERVDAAGIVRPPGPAETGYKDTVIAFPEEITRIKATFDIPGLYVWHCHIVEHEDNEMMRPFRVGEEGA